MIKTFRGKTSAAIFAGRLPKGFPPDVAQAARRKLRMVSSAKVLSDLKVLPGNRLEVLQGDREGQHSIRINDQWHVCFVWSDGDAYCVEIVDYH